MRNRLFRLVQRLSASGRVRPSLDYPRKNRDDPPPTLVRPDPTSGSGGSRSGEGLKLLQTLLCSNLPLVDHRKSQTLEEALENVDESDFRSLTPGFKLNPWPFFWAVVNAWIWYGALHLTHVI
jgi:hypothetical protein